MKFLHALWEWANVRRHISARVFRSVFFSLFILSALLIGAYSFSAFNDITKIVIDRGQSSVNTIAAQTDLIAGTLAQTHALLFSSEDVYTYLYRSAGEMPSYQWFQVYNDAQKILRLLGRGQVNLIMGMLLYHAPQEYIQYGSLYAMLNPYALPSSQLNRLLLYNGHVYYVSAATTSGSGRAFLVSQLYDSALDDLCTGLVADDSSLLVLDGQGNVFRQYTSGSQDAAQVREALRASGLSQGLLAGKWHLVSAAAEGAGLTFSMAFPVVTTSRKLMEVSPWLFPALLFSLLAGLALSYGISRRLAGGLRVMQENMALVERKEYDRIKIIPSQDELGQLSEAFAHMARRISALIRENQDRERKEHELQIQVLRAQVSPHFLYNTLNNMRQLAAMQGMGHIDRMATALIQLLRAALDSEGLLIPLSQELEYVSNYYEICKYQYLEDFRLEIQVEDELLDCLTLQMVLQPIVENAIIHGISKNPGTGIIRIRALRESGRLRISVVDNGQGIGKEQLAQLLHQEHNTSRMRFSGIGIHNVQERIRMRFGEAYGLTIRSREGCYTRVDILLPYLTKEGEA